MAAVPEAQQGMYLLCFHFEEPGEEDTTGTFQFVVKAENPEAALDQAAQRIRELRIEADMFDRPVTIYFEGGLLLKGEFDRGVLVNWEQRVARAPGFTLSNLCPAERDCDELLAFHWPGEDDGDGGATIPPFLDFGGQEFRRAVRDAKARDAKDSAAGVQGAAWDPSPKHSEPSEEERQERAEARKRKKAHAVGRAKVRETLTELSGSRRK